MGTGSIGGGRIAKRLGGFGLVAGLALGGAACGDDNGTDAAPLTRAEFIEQADAICLRTQDEVEPHFETVWASLEGIDEQTVDGQDTTFAAFDELMETVGPMWRDMAGEIGELTPPIEDQALIETLISDLEAAIEEMDRVIDDAVAGDEAARRALDDSDPMDDVDRRAQDYGMVVCGSDG